ncbi:MAG TPA: hypothetical protein VHX62_17030 [Solirubrobacteraceae bacterium]|jgi:hypothetical protein|nr:hypothetical protein [Solirubrobacteraceae bacterium]
MADRERERRAREKREDDGMARRAAADDAVLAKAAHIDARLKQTGDWHDIAEFGDGAEPAVKELQRTGRVERDGGRVRAEQRSAPN